MSPSIRIQPNTGQTPELKDAAQFTHFYLFFMDFSLLFYTVRSQKGTEVILSLLQTFVFTKVSIVIISTAGSVMICFIREIAPGSRELCESIVCDGTCPENARKSVSVDRNAVPRILLDGCP